MGQAGGIRNDGAMGHDRHVQSIGKSKSRVRSFMRRSQFSAVGDFEQNIGQHPQ
jgi:hypothetical protein